MSVRENESLINVHSWCCDVEYKRWLLTEYMASHSYSERLALLLDLIRIYFECLFRNAKFDRGISLPHIKFLRMLNKDFFQCRWMNSDEESKSETLLLFISELCQCFNSISDKSLSFAFFYFLFTIDKSNDKYIPSIDVERKTDFELIIMSSISFPSIMLLESAILYIIHLNPTQKSPIEFRIGSTVFIELCSIVPDGAKTLNSLIVTAPLFAAYVYFCICRKLANKLRSVVPLKSHHASVVKIDGCPVFSVLENIILFLERLPEFSDIEKMYEMNIPDLHSGDVRNFISPSLSPIDDLAHIVVGYSLWSSSPNFNENMKKMFIRLSLLLNDVLTSFKSSDEDIKQNQRESSVEEGEEGELEQGELIDDVDEVKDNCEQSSIPIRLAGFVCRMHEFGVIVDGQIQDVISRMTQIFQVFLNSKSISASEASALLKYLEKLPFNYNLSQVISNLKLLSPE